MQALVYVDAFPPLRVEPHPTSRGTVVPGGVASRPGQGVQLRPGPVVADGAYDAYTLVQATSLYRGFFLAARLEADLGGPQCLFVGQ